MYSYILHILYESCLFQSAGENTKSDPKHDNNTRDDLSHNIGCISVGVC